MDAMRPDAAPGALPEGTAPWQVRVQHAAFDVAAELAQTQGADLGIGGIGLFVGTVRDLQGAHAPPADAVPGLQALELEHYPGMTEKALAGILEQARQRFGLRAGRIVHRVGRLDPGEPIVLVIAAAAHRQAALDGCAFMMDWLKTDAPFWKKEHTGAGSRWVEARESDDRARARWGEGVARAGADTAVGPAVATEPEAVPAPAHPLAPWPATVGAGGGAEGKAQRSIATTSLGPAGTGAGSGKGEGPSP